MSGPAAPGSGSLGPDSRLPLRAALAAVAAAAMIWAMPVWGLTTPDQAPDRDYTVSQDAGSPETGAGVDPFRFGKGWRFLQAFADRLDGVGGAGLQAALSSGLKARLAGEIERLPALREASSGPLEVIRIAPTPRITYLHLVQTHEGRPVLGSRITLRVDSRGRPAALSGAVLPSPSSGGVPKASPLPASLLRQAALEGLPLVEEPSEWPEESEAWLPWPGPDGSTWLRPVRRLQFRTEDPPGWWDTVVDERTGEVLVRLNRLAHQLIEGTVRGLVEPSTAGDPLVEYPFSGVTVQASQPGFLLSDTTDADGRFRLDLPADGEYKITMLLRGTRAWIQDASQALATPTDTLRTATPAELQLLWDGDNSVPSQRNAFYHVNQAHAFVRALDADSALSALDQTMRVRVEDPSGYCNAYWNGSRLNFYAAGAGCVSSGRVADVVYHEYGHAVTQYCYNPFLVPDDMGEAFSDYIAATITGQPYIGRGFYGPGTYIREVETDRVWPDDRSPSIHLQGLILAGALWDLRKELGAAYTDSLFHFARYGAAQTYDDYMLDLLLWDDDDGDLDNGTPHFSAITRAFRAHGIGDYSVRIEHEPLPDMEEPGPLLEARAWIRSLFPLDPDSVALYYSTGGPFERLDAFPIDGTREYGTLLPSAPSGSAVSYYWTAVDTSGTRASLPPDAPDSVFTFLIGPDQVAPVIEHVPETVITADRTRLSLWARITDNSNRLGPIRASLDHEDGGGPWEADFHPRAREGQWRAEIDLPGLTAGTGVLYHLLAQDQALTPNQTRLPDAPGEYQVQVRRGATLSLDSGPGPLVPSAEWSWGAPAAPVEAWSGSRVWATNPAGAYQSNTSASLVWGPLDLSGFERARLEIRHLYRFEAGYDGGRVEYSAGPLGPWFPLEPEEPYPYQLVRALDGPGFSGDSGRWIHSRFPLDSHLGRQVWIRFQVESDAYVQDLGWYLDDLVLVEAQALSSPRDLRIAECGPDCLDLAWQPPAEVDASSPRFLGYAIHRAEADGPFGQDPIHPGPLRTLQYRDAGLHTGTAYRYRLSALYDEGASIPLEKEATPFAPALVLETEAVEYRLHGFTESDTTLMVENGTGGTLQFDAFLAEPGADLDEVRVVWEFGDSMGGPHRLLLQDGRDAGGTLPDLASLEARTRDDDELGELLDLRLRVHEPWTDPLQTWGALIWLDTDRNLATGRQDYNLGAEYIVALGKLATEAGHDGPALLLDAQMRPLIGLLGVDFRPGSDSLSVPIPWNLLERPETVRILVTLAPSLTQPAFDRMPDLPGLPWLDREPRHGRATPGHPQPFSLNFDADPVGVGTYEAVLFLESNDAGRPVLEVPVTLTVSGLLPQEVQDLDFSPGPEGMAITFRLPTDVEIVGAAVERAAAQEVVWREVTSEPLVPDSTGVFRFLDRSVESGREYLYRFRTLFSEGRLVVYGPHQALYDFLPEAVRLYPARPSPFRESTRLRLDLPEAAEVRVEIFDASGRKVRDELGGSLSPGVAWIEWDGTDSGGRRLSSGIYWARVSAGPWRETIRLAIVR